MDNEKIKELILRIQNKDRQALSELYSETRTGVYALALVYTGSDFDAEDIMQNTFLKIWLSAPSCRISNPKSWIMTITRNLALDLLRTRKRSTELRDDFPADDCFKKISDNAMLRTLLSQLKEDERVIVLLYSYGFTFDEISATVKRPKSTVHLKYSRAVDKLRKISGGENDG